MLEGTADYIARFVRNLRDVELPEPLCYEDETAKGLAYIEGLRLANSNAYCIVEGCCKP